MKFLDLFAGVGGIRLGMEQAGHECVGWVEWDKFARKSYQTIHDTTNEWTETDINNVKATDIPRANVWCFGFPCSPAGAKVKTINGYKNIENIEKGDLVLTHQGRYQKVVQPMSKIAGAINKINAKGVFNLQLTDNHPLYVYNINTKEFEWVKASELNKDIHYLTLNINTKEDRVALSNDDIWLLGRYVSDGYKSKNASSYTQFAVRNSKEDEFVSHLDGYDYSIYHSDRTAHEYVVKDQKFSNLADKFGDGAKNKHLPEWIINAPIDQIKIFIDGYLSGDGYISDVRTMWSTVSEELALGLQSLSIKAFHKVPAIYVRHDKRSTTFNDTYNSQIHKKDVGTFVVGNYMCTKIKSIERTEHPIEVFNMEVENDNSYTLENVVVHNCQDISVAGKQGGFTNGKRSSLFFTVTGLIRQLKEEDRPSYLLIENVKNLLSINGGWDFLKLQIELDEIGYDVEWDVLDSAEVVPQHRERVFIIGHLRGRNTRKVFPIIRENGKTDSPKQKIIRVFDGRNTGTYGSQDVVSPDGIAGTLNTMTGGGREPKIIVREATKKGYAEAVAGDSVNISQPNSKTRRGRVGKQRANTLETSLNQGVVIPVLTPNRINKRQNGRRFKEDGDPEFTLTAQDRHGVLTNSYDEIKQVASSVKKYANAVRPNAKPIVRITNKKDIRGSRQDSKKSGLSELQFTNPINKSSTVTASHAPKTWDKELRIRKLTPLECWRLQGFPDWAFDKAQEVNSNSQLYKQAGNSVTVPVIKAIAERLSEEEEK